MIPDDDPNMTEITYPRSFEDPYMRPGIQLGIWSLCPLEP